MKLVWHIVTKDVRRIWLPLAFWAVVITAKHVVDWKLLTTVKPDVNWSEQMKLVATLLFALKLIIGYALTAALVTEDSPIGTTAFWMTRPISGWRLLVGKFVACALLLIIFPLLVSGPWIFSSGQDGLQLRESFPSILMWQFWTVCLAFAVAALTGTFARFLAWTLVLPFVFGGLVAVWLSSVGRQLQEMVGPANRPLPWNGVLLFAVMGIMAGMIVLYRLRRPRPALLMIGAAAMVGLIFTLCTVR
jgi:ABC-type transport system involved in multi-copper enzyme maturation permease subunit